MTAPRGGRIVDGYLAQVEVALGDLPTEQRARVVGHVRDHIARERASLADDEESDMDVFRLLDQIGEPAAAAVRFSAGLEAAPRTGWHEVLAIAGLFIAWPVGVVLLWLSRVWSIWAKLIGTLLLPGGYAVSLIVQWVVLDHADLLSCTTVSENGQVVSSNCPLLLQNPDLVTVFVNVLLWPWIVITSISAIYLAVRAWGSIGPLRRAAWTAAGGRGAPRGALLRLALVLTVLSGLVLALLIVSDIIIFLLTGKPG